MVISLIYLVILFVVEVDLKIFAFQDGLGWLALVAFSALLLASPFLLSIAQALPPFWFFELTGALTGSRRWRQPSLAYVAVATDFGQDANRYQHWVNRLLGLQDFWCNFQILFAQYCS